MVTERLPWPISTTVVLPESSSRAAADNTLVATAADISADNPRQTADADEPRSGQSGRYDSRF